MGNILAGSNFIKTRTQNAIWVDKSLLIKEFLDSSSEVSLVTRPRRFGKTFNLNMLEAFLSSDRGVSRALFEGTLIERAVCRSGEMCMEHFGKYPVIFFSFGAIRSSNFDSMVRRFRFELAELYTKYSYLEESSALTPRDKEYFQGIVSEDPHAMWDVSLHKLIAFLHAHHQKRVIVLIDEYDTPAHEAYAAPSPFYEPWIEVMRQWLGHALKDNPHPIKVVITGILRVSMNNLFSGINNLTVDSMVQPIWCGYFGFNASEVEWILKYAKLESLMGDVQKWYDGYQLGEHELYNPWSVIQLIAHQGTLGCYWSGSGDHSILAKAILQCQDLELLETLKELLLGRVVEVAVDERTLFYRLGQQSASVWGLMLYSGYLCALSSRHQNGQLFVKIKLPNYEVHDEIEQMVRQWVGYSSAGVSGRSDLISDFMVGLERGDLHPFFESLQSYLLQSASFHDFHRHTPERFYHVFLLGMMTVLKDRYTVVSNREAGLGRLDIALIPKQSGQRGALIEVKSASSSSSSLDELASAALEQIDTQSYHAIMQSHGVNQVLLVGLGFEGKKVLGSTHLLDLT